MSAPGHDNAEVLSRLDEIEQHLDRRMQRLEVAIMGDPEMGTPGIGGRLRLLESFAEQAPNVHQSMIDTSKQDINELEGRTSSARERLWKAIRDQEGRISRLDRRWYLQAGLMIGSGLGGGWIGALLATGGGMG